MTCKYFDRARYDTRGVLPTFSSISGADTAVARTRSTLGLCIADNWQYFGRQYSAHTAIKKILLAVIRVLQFINKFTYIEQTQMPPRSGI